MKEKDYFYIRLPTWLLCLMEASVEYKSGGHHIHDTDNAAG